MAAKRKVRVTYDTLADLADLGRPGNPKAHNVEAIEESVDAVGYVEPVVVNDSDGLILSGHGRVAALVAMRARDEPPPAGISVSRAGEWLVPVLHGVELSEEEARRYVVAANQTTIAGGWVDTDLEASLAALAESEIGLVGTGFVEDDLAALRAALAEPEDGKTDPDDVPEPPDEPYVERGDLYALGDHRLLCGDATSVEDAERLLDGAQAAMMWTDPPYGVAYRGGAKPRAPMEGDESPDVALAGLTLVAAHVAPGAPFYAAVPPGPLRAQYVDTMLAAGWYVAMTLAWVKQSFAGGWGDYRGQWEPLLYGWREGASHVWRGGRSQSTVFMVDRPQRSDEHPTMKPVGLVEPMIVNSSVVGGIVLDPFLGSGTTMIAAERLGRRCYGMEIEPRYVQVAIERWQNFTGEKAVKL